jgi:hypothetical protein
VVRWVPACGVEGLLHEDAEFIARSSTDCHGLPRQTTARPAHSPSHVLADSERVRTLLTKLVDTFDAPCHGLAGKARQPDRGNVNGGSVSFTHVCVTLAVTDRWHFSRRMPKWGKKSERVAMDSIADAVDRWCVGHIERCSQQLCNSASILPFPELVRPKDSYVSP